jgi:hypothetical protein
MRKGVVAGHMHSLMREIFGFVSLRAKRGNLDFGQWRLLSRVPRDSAPRNDMVRHLSARMRKTSESDRIFENCHERTNCFVPFAMTIFGRPQSYLPDFSF